MSRHNFVFLSGMYLSSDYLRVTVPSIPRVVTGVQGPKPPSSHVLCSLLGPKDISPHAPRPSSPPKFPHRPPKKVSAKRALVVCNVGARALSCGLDRRKAVLPKPPPRQPKGKIERAPRRKYQRLPSPLSPDRSRLPFCSPRPPLPRRPLRPHPHKRLGTPGRNHPLRPIHGRQRQPRHPRLFRKYPTVEAFAALTPEQLEPDVRSTGFFRNKSKSVVGAAKKSSPTSAAKSRSTWQDLSPSPASPARPPTSSSAVGSKSRRRRRRHPRPPHLPPPRTHTNNDPQEIEQDLMRIIPRENGSSFPPDHLARPVTLLARKPKCVDCLWKTLPRRGQNLEHGGDAQEREAIDLDVEVLNVRNC